MSKADKLANPDITVDKNKFDALLKVMIASKPVTFKELVKKPKGKKSAKDGLSGV